MAFAENDTKHAAFTGIRFETFIQDYTDHILCVIGVHEGKLYRGILFEQTSCDQDNQIGVNPDRIVGSKKWPPITKEDLNSQVLENLSCMSDRYSYMSTGQLSTLNAFERDAGKCFHRKQRPKNISRILRPRSSYCRKCRASLHSATAPWDSTNNNDLIKQVTPPIIPITRLSSNALSDEEQSFDTPSATAPAVQVNPPAVKPKVRAKRKPKLVTALATANPVTMPRKRRRSDQSIERTSNAKAARLAPDNCADATPLKVDLTRLPSANSPNDLGVSPGRRVKDCEKPKHRWIRAERMRRSQENNETKEPSGGASVDPAKNGQPDGQRVAPLCLKLRIERSAISVMATGSGGEGCPGAQAANGALSWRTVPGISHLSRSTAEAGDIVWGKLAGWPYWPAEVTQIFPSPENGGRRLACLHWFAWSQVSYLDVDKLEPFESFYSRRYNSKRKNSSYQEAVRLAREALKNRKKVEKPKVIEKPKVVEEKPKVVEEKPKEGEGHKATPCPIAGKLPSFQNPLELCSNVPQAEEEAPGPPKALEPQPVSVAPVIAAPITPALTTPLVATTPAATVETAATSTVASPTVALQQAPVATSTAPVSSGVSVDVPTFSEDESDGEEKPLRIDPDWYAPPTQELSALAMPKTFPLNNHKLHFNSLMATAGGASRPPEMPPRTQPPV